MATVARTRRVAGVPAGRATREWSLELEAELTNGPELTDKRLTEALLRAGARYAGLGTLVVVETTSR